MMSLRVALLSLMFDRVRLITGLLGVAFAVLLVFINLGFLGALNRTAALLYEQLDADIYIISPLSLNGTATKTFKRDRLYQMAADPAVQKSMALYISSLQWRNPDTAQKFFILGLGFNPIDHLFRLPELQNPDMIARLQDNNTVLFDQRSLPKYGDISVGSLTEAGRQSIRVGGLFKLGGGLAAEGTILMSDQNFYRLFAPHPPDQISLGLLKLLPDRSIEETLQRLRTIMPNDIEVYSKTEIIARDQQYWLETTSVGFIFTLGVGVALLVGASIVYQILYADIAKNHKEYATLKAIGFQGSFLFNVVMQSAWLLAILGYLPGLLFSYLTFSFILQITDEAIPMVMHRSQMIQVAVLTLIMCSLSAFGAIRKVMKTDPAEVF